MGRSMVQFGYGGMYDKGLGGLGGQVFETVWEAVHLEAGLLSHFSEPFNPVTDIRFTLKAGSHVFLDV